jgi:hypothetical protein
MRQITPSMSSTHDPGQYGPAHNEVPICVCYGAGVDSTALLIRLSQLGVRPDLITFADVGSEKPETYLYVPIMRQYLSDVGFPDLVMVRYTPPIAPYDSLAGNCLANETLPSVAFNFARHSCSLKWKRAPQDAW